MGLNDNEFELQKIAKGEVLKEFINSPEGLSINLTGGLITFYLTMSSPTKSEIDIIQYGDLKTRCGVIEGIPIISFRINGDWYMDAAIRIKEEHNPLVKIEDPTLGYGLNIILIDSITGTVKAFRVKASTNKFANKFYKIVDGLEVVDESKFLEETKKVYKKYDSKEIYNMSK